MKYTCWFSDETASNLALVGEKGLNIFHLLTGGLPVPPGFCIMTNAQSYLLKVTGLDQIIHDLVRGIDFTDQADVGRTSLAIRDLFEQQPIPNEIAGEILENYFTLGQQLGYRHLESMPVAVRPSATVADSPQIALSNCLDAFFNVQGGYSVLRHLRRCWASAWNDRALIEIHRLGIDHQKVRVAAVVQAIAHPHDQPTISRTHTFA